MPGKSPDTMPLTMSVTGLNSCVPKFEFRNLWQCLSRCPQGAG
jgi:hypothetical protein